MATNLIIGRNVVDTFPASNSNRLTPDYGMFLIGQINRNNMQDKAVMVVTDRYGNDTYYLVSQR